MSIGFDPQAPVNLKVRELIAKSGPAGWDDAWKEGATFWDVGYIQPAVKALLESNRVNWPREGRALVPGCGKGWEVVFIADTLGLQVTGTDLSETAIQIAKETHKDSLSQNISFEIGNFFEVNEDDPFDLIFDYTFFVALPPSMRPDWGKKMTKLVKPGGYLITHIFPIDPPQDHGPPHYVRPAHYEEVLGDTLWEKVLDEVPTVTDPTHIDRERIVVRRRL